MQAAKVAGGENAERQYQRAQSLAERKLVAAGRPRHRRRPTPTRAEAQVDGRARQRSRRRKAALHQAQVNLDYTTIVSPINGVVISRSVDVGQTVAASLQAPTLFVIAEDLRKMQVDTSVAEADVGKLKPGMEATLHRRRVSRASAFHGDGPPDPQRAADPAERRHLRRGHRRRRTRSSSCGRA